ncbi:MAG: DUF2723 domain-containing protein [Lentimicrobiaceae bacterium]
MEKFKRLNNIGGVVSFVIAAIVYTLTLEPTASWWDCGEYISTAFKLQVGHPPGAPLFQLLGRFFSLFAFGNTLNVAFMINLMSGIVSALTIMFLFWTITHIVRKLVASDNEITLKDTIIVLASGFIGAIAFAFSDSFWFSAVEGEVYAMSSFFTAVVFWAILKWEEQYNQKHSIRWIILIAYLVGLSIGVHLLNLLAIPAISFILYFKKYPNVTRKGIISTAIISVLVLSLVNFVIVPGVVDLAAKFELFFVNTIGLPFNTGTLIYFAVIIGGLAYGIVWSQRKRKFILNTVILSLTFILIGYSSFLMLVIRANANTPINENDPDDAISLLSYLNREQYGSWPILTGPYYNAPVDPQNPADDGSPIYIRDNQKGKYVITDERKNSITRYDSRFTTFLPRMHSPQDSHIRAYKSWGKVKGVPITVTNEQGETEVLYKPTFGENLRFLFSYQMGHMYFRYFMWNFAGRQNDTQGNGGIKNGNWISGITALDEMRLGKQTDLPQSMKSDARNTYFLLPLILGIIGMLTHFNKNYKDGVVIALLFFMTGIAIVLYLNQTPFQPRERDYAYTGSFYAFAIWLGVGVFAIYDSFKKWMSSNIALPLTVLLTLSVPAIMLAENYDDHDRSGKYAARDFAANYLNSCDKNAILITNGDNDTFPLWYAQEVEGVRTDVRVVNYLLSSGDWYVHQLARKIYNSEPLKFQLTPDQYNKGVNEYLPIYEQTKERVELKDVMDFIASDNLRSKVSMNSGEKVNYVPTRKIRLSVNKVNAIKNGIVPSYMVDSIVPYIDWDIRANYLFKNDLMLMDFLANNNWERPIYFASPSSVSKVFDIDKYCHQTGIVYKFIPVLAYDYYRGLGGVDEIASYNILVNKAKWGDLNNPKVTADPESKRNASMLKQNYIRLAKVLVQKGKYTKAIAVVDKLISEFPNEKFTFDIYMLSIADIYYKSGDTVKGNDFIRTVARVYGSNIAFYNQVNPKFAEYYKEDSEEALMIMAKLFSIAKQNNQDKLYKELDRTYILPKELKTMFN